MVQSNNTDVAASGPVIINPNTNNPQSVQQQSELGLTDNNGLGERGFELSIDLTGSDVAQQINIALAIDTSGSTADDSGTDFDGDGTNETILEGQLFGALVLFDAYVAAGYPPEEINISLVDYSASATQRGTFDLSDRAAFINELEAIRDDGPGGTTNYVAGLNTSNQAFADNGASQDDTNIVVFLSDGFPVPGSQQQPGPGGTTPIENAAAALENDWGALINGIGIGANSSLPALNQLDNTNGATQVLSGQEFLDEIVAPLTDTEFLGFTITIADEDPNTPDQVIQLDVNDPAVISTPTGFFVDCLPIDPTFMAGQQVDITVSGNFSPEPGSPPGTQNQVVLTEHQDITLVVCFTPGTLILTPDGLRPVEALVPGDRVVTRDHGVQPVRWVGKTPISAPRLEMHPELRPVLIRKDALAPGQPDRDMRVSRQHRVLVRGWRAEMLFGDADGVLVPAVALINDTTIVEDHGGEPVTYLHLAFDRHEVIYADGIEAESFHPAARTIATLDPAQQAELKALFPDLARGDAYAFHAARPELRARDGQVLAPGD